MTEGPRPAPATLLRLAAPLMLSFTLRSLLTAIDLPYGALLGDGAVAAMGLALPLEFAFLACWIGLSGAMTSHLSHAMGARREERMVAVVRATTRIVLGVSALFLVLAGVVWLVTPHLGLDADVAANFRIYAPVVVAGAALVGFWSVIPDSIVKAHHDTRSTMIAGLLSGGLNVALNTLFVLLGWGILGLALATFLGRTGGLVYALARARRLEARRRAEWKGADATPDPHPLLRPYHALLLLAVPTSLAYILMACEGVIANVALARYPDAKAAMAAFAIFHRASSVLLMPIVGVSAAIVPYVARAIGEGRRGEVRGAVREALAFAAAYAALVAAPMCFLVAEPLARFLGDAPSTERLAGVAIRWGTPLFVLAAGPFILSRPTFEALQRGGPALVMAVVRYLGLSAPLGLAGAALAVHVGRAPLEGLLCGFIAGTGVASMIFLGWLSRALRAL